MRNPLAGLAFALAFITQAIGADLPPVHDSNHHGDPPFLLEDGWKPLLNGKNLDGWTYRSPQRAGWHKSRSRREEALNSPGSSK